ncbi:MAG: peptidoglycan DD-metalloendopeptidase family protein [Brevundimonas sp.]|uniref:peptidoglycan DD-metalloendopeptidase family protein n=1 Tax=Brevundimonas sp. TaxID=1871086 RepID=UPI003918D794
MIRTFASRLSQLVERIFPERHLYLRCDGETRGYVLTTGRQMLMAGVATVMGGWMVLSTGGFMLGALAESRAEAEIARSRAASERVNADLQARLESAVIRMSATTGSLEETAQMVERRHAALTQVMGMFNGIAGAEEVLAPARPLDPDTNSPIRRIASVQTDQERLIARAEDFAQNRAERLRLAFRLAGLNPSAYAATSTALGGPLVEARDPRALAAVLDVDEAFAVRIRNAAEGLSDMRSLADSAGRLPFGRPVRAARTTSGFGVRFDPFNGRPALHQGQDFAAPANTPILATAPGVVSFAGVRGGYGRTVEIDHGGGFKTRYAHLHTIAVQTGQRISVGNRIGGMGTTGRSTGVHLHYEVWMDGRPQNPARFLRAGEQIVQQD